MLDAMTSSAFFGIALTAFMWCVGCWVQKKTGWILCNSLLITVAGIILFLTAAGIPYEDYDVGGSYIKVFLGPVTAMLALNIYNQRKVLKEYFIPVLAGCFAGSASSLASMWLLCRLLGVEEGLTASLLPKSCTTAIAIAISESRGGVAGITVAAVMVAGLTGTVMAPIFGKLFRVDDPVAEGLAIGACSHALGTTKAIELGELQGAMSSIAICLCGIISSVLTLFM